MIRLNTILPLTVILCLFISSSMIGQFYPEKHKDLSQKEYERYTKKLKSKYETENHFSIAFLLSTLKAPKAKVEQHLKTAIDTQVEETCESIFQVQNLANKKFYQTLYRNDTLLFKNVFNRCLDELGADAFDLYMEEEEKKSAIYQQSLPQIDSAKMDVALIKSLQKIEEDDQKYRKKIDVLYNTKEENDSYWKLQEELDALNLIRADSILNTKGYPETAAVGHDLSNTIFLVLQHQSDLEVRKKYRPVIEEISNGSDLLYVYDRATTDLHNNKEYDTIDKRVERCLENTETEEIEIIVEGEVRKVLSHDTDETCILGAVLPDFEAIDIHQESISTQSLTGKVNVINFWFTQCKPCLKEMPFLNTLVDQFEGQEVNFVAFNRDDLTTTKNLLAKNEFKFRIIADAQALIKNKMKMIWGYPITIVTDKQNKVVATFRACLNKNCEEKMIQTIEKHL